MSSVPVVSQSLHHGRWSRVAKKQCNPSESIQSYPTIQAEQVHESIESSRKRKRTQNCAPLSPPALLSLALRFPLPPPPPPHLPTPLSTSILSLRPYSFTSTLPVTLSSHSSKIPNLPFPTATTFVVPRTDRRPTRTLTVIRDRPLSARHIRLTAADFSNEKDVLVSPEEYLRQNEPTPKNKEEEKESAVYDRLYKYVPHLTTEWAMEDRVGVLPVDESKKLGSLSFDLNVEDEEDYSPPESPMDALEYSDQQYTYQPTRLQARGWISSVWIT